jgi:predicted DNA-binding transcriptional regulator AlpA
MSHKSPAIQFDDLPDAAMIQIRPLVDYKVLPYSATTIWRLCRNKKFPPPYKVTSGITAWRVGDIRKYLEAVGTSASKEVA